MPQFRSAYFLMLYMWMGSQLALRSRSCMASGTIGSTGFSSRHPLATFAAHGTFG